MTRASKRKSTQVKNPVAIYLAIVGVGALCVVGVTSILGWKDLLAILATPILLICSLLVIVYTLFALRLRYISTVGRRGQVYHYTQDEEPVLFFFLVFFYLVLAVPTALYLASIVIGN